MNLLKLLFVVVLTASLTVILSNSAHAVDHPWDDRPTDTTTVGNRPESGSSTNPVPTVPVISRIIEWTRLMFLEIKGIFVGPPQPAITVVPDKPEKNHGTKRIQRLGGVKK